MRANLRRLIVGAVSPHRVENASESSGQRDDRDLFAASAFNRLFPAPKGGDARVGGSAHAPGGLDQQRLDIRVGTPHHPASLLVLPGAVLPRNQAEITGDLGGTPPSRKSTHVIEGGHERGGGDRPDAGTGGESFDDRVVRDQGLKLRIGLRQFLVEDLRHLSYWRERLLEREREIEVRHALQKTFPASRRRRDTRHGA